MEIALRIKSLIDTKTIRDYFELNYNQIKMSDKPSKSQKSVKFLLAPRPQKDPLAADYEAPQNILVPKDGTDIDEIRKRLPDFDENVFASKQETKTGMLERAHNADGITFDPDILKAMSKDFNFEDPNNVLDDDFMDQAGGLIEDEGELLDDEMTDLANELFEDEPEVINFASGNRPSDSSLEDSDDYDADRDLAKVGKSNAINEDTFGYGKRLILFKKKSKMEAIKPIMRNAAHEVQAEDEDDHADDDEDTKTVFTNYSMTSSVMRRSRGLQQIDEHFERLYEKEYADDTEIGPLDLNEVKGDELLKNIEQLKREVKCLRKKNHGDDYEPEIVSEHYKNAIIGDDDDQKDLVAIETTQRENRVDCESILSYNSNLYNHPKLIIESSRKRTSSQNNSDKMDTSCGQSIASSRATILAGLSTRPKNETPEERRARKKSLKTFRNERRQERKQNEQIFKSEKANLIKQRKNLPTLKL